MVETARTATALCGVMKAPPSENEAARIESLTRVPYQADFILCEDTVTLILFAWCFDEVTGIVFEDITTNRPVKHHAD